MGMENDDAEKSSWQLPDENFPPTNVFAKAPPDDYFMLAARGLRACAQNPDEPLPLEDVAKRMSIELLGASDGNYNAMLDTHAQMLNATFAVMLERGMNNPDPFSTAISAGLRAQKQFLEIARVRGMMAMEGIAKEKWDEKKYAIYCKQNEQKRQNR